MERCGYTVIDNGSNVNLISIEMVEKTESNIEPLDNP